MQETKQDVAGHVDANADVLQRQAQLLQPSHSSLVESTPNEAPQELCVGGCQPAHARGQRRGGRASSMRRLAPPTHSSCGASYSALSDRARRRGQARLQDARGIAQAARERVHAADVAVEQVHHVRALPPQLGVKVDAACAPPPGRRRAVRSLTAPASCCLRGTRGWPRRASRRCRRLARGARAVLGWRAPGARPPCLRMFRPIRVASRGSVRNCRARRRVSRGRQDACDRGQRHQVRACRYVRVPAQPLCSRPPLRDAGHPLSLSRARSRAPSAQRLCLLLEAGPLTT
jgi:hypothetical protein